MGGAGLLVPLVSVLRQLIVSSRLASRLVRRVVIERAESRPRRPRRVSMTTRRVSSTPRLSSSRASTTMVRVLLRLRRPSVSVSSVVTTPEAMEDISASGNGSVGRRMLLSGGSRDAQTY